MVHHVQFLEVSVLDIRSKTEEHFLYLKESEGTTPTQSHQWEELHLLTLIVKQFGLRLGVLEVVLELTADGRVSESDGKSSRKIIKGMWNQLEPYVAH